MKTFIRSLFAAALLVLLPAAVIAQDTLTGQAAPALTFKDLAGKEVSLAALKGKVIVVDFWATWCGPCRQEIPGYIEMQKKYEKDGLVIVGVSLDQKGPKVVKKFVEANGMNYTVVMGDDKAVDAFGGFNSIPTTFLINREGRIVHQKSGAMAHAAYEELVKKAL
jgi:thiol-disulfide isomerase/thioredoxin